MTLSTRGITALAVAALGGLLLLMTAYAVLELRSGLSGPQRSLLAVDLVILASGHAGLSVLLALHLRGLVMHRIEATTAVLWAHADGRLGERLPEDGPRELRRLATAANRLAEATEKRQRRILQEAHRAAAADLLLGVAHEIRNPLAAARLSIQALASMPDAGPHAATHGRLLRSLDRIEEVVRTLQEIARPGGTTDPNRIVRGGIMAVQGEMLHLADASLDLEATQRVDCDASAVLQSLVAVLRNAIEATPAGDAVHVRTRDDGEEVVIEVRDVGPGLPPELAARIFEPFTTSKTGHAGLGLALARQAIAAQGGRLELHEGDGLRVTIRLPAR